MDSLFLKFVLKKLHNLIYCRVKELKSDNEKRKNERVPMKRKRMKDRQ